VKRLFKFSFDPYPLHRATLGATSEDELASCADPSSKTRWYEAEQRLRNQVDRTYDARMDFAVGDLESRAPGSGSDSAPDIDVKAVIDNMGLPRALHTDAAAGLLIPRRFSAPQVLVTDSLQRAANLRGITALLDRSRSLVTSDSIVKLAGELMPRPRSWPFAASSRCC